MSFSVTQKIVLLSLHTKIMDGEFADDERTIEIGCIRSSIQVKKVSTFPLSVYMFKVNNVNARTIDVIGVVLMSSFLMLSMFPTLPWCFCCWLWTSKLRLGCLKERFLLVIIFSWININLDRRLKKNSRFSKKYLLSARIFIRRNQAKDLLVKVSSYIEICHVRIVFGWTHVSYILKYFRFLSWNFWQSRNEALMRNTATSNLESVNFW